MLADLKKADPKHWIVTRCGKWVDVSRHSVRDFSWEFADLQNPQIIERCLQFQIDPRQFTVNHPKIDLVEDAISEQIPYYYWVKPNRTTFAVLDLAVNNSGILFMKNADIDVMVGDDNWSLITDAHPAKKSFKQRLEAFQSKSSTIKDTLYFLGEDSGWLILYKMKANKEDGIRLEGILFHRDPQLQLSTQQQWERHGNKSLFLAFTKKGVTPHLQDSIWISIGWSLSKCCLRSQIQLSESLVNDLKFEDGGISSD